MRFHYLLYFEAEEYTFHNIYSQIEPLDSSLTKNFLGSSLYELQNKKIFAKLKEELVDIIQVIEFFKIELNLNLNNSDGFSFFVLRFTSPIELFSHIGNSYVPIGNKADKLLNKISSRLYKIQEIRHTSRFLVNTYIPPNLRNDLKDNIEKVIQNSEKSESLIYFFSWQQYPFIIEFQHNFWYNFDEEFTKLIKKYITDELSIDHINWDAHILDYSNRGILIYPDEKIDFKKVSDLLSESLIQKIYGIYTRISDYLRYYQQKLINLDEILPKLNYSEFLSNLKLLKFNTFGGFPLLYLQEIDRILLRTTEDSAERLDPPISEIFDNSAFGYNIYDKIMSAYTSLKEELNSALTTLQIIMSQNHTDKKPIEEKPKEKIKLVEYEKQDASRSKEHKIPDVIIQGIEKSIEISNKCVSEGEKISPKVGAVLIEDNRIVETAYRGEIEEGDHAEYTLLERKLKSKEFSNTILITTLEPCTRRGSNKTSCAERIVQAGIRQVWIGINDPNPDISTRGCTYLRMKNVSINFFPDEYAQKVLRLNKEFWENEIKKYKHDVMLAPDHPREDKNINSSERLEKIEETLKVRKMDETKTKKIEIKLDLELINEYLDMIKNSQLSSTNIVPMLNKIHNLFAKILFKEDFTENELDVIKKYIESVDKYILSKNNDLIKRPILGTVRMLVLKPIFLELVKSLNYHNFKKLYERGYNNSDITLILYKCGYFNSISTEIYKAIDKKDIDTLQNFRNLLDSTEIEENIIHIIKELRLKKEMLSSSSDLNLSDMIESIISSLESLHK